MKVFEVKTQGVEKDGKLLDTIRYVTSYDDSFVTVANWYYELCEQREEDLVSIREVVTICHHIKKDSITVTNLTAIAGQIKTWDPENTPSFLVRTVQDGDGEFHDWIYCNGRKICTIEKKARVVIDNMILEFIYDTDDYKGKGLSWKKISLIHTPDTSREEMTCRK